MHCLLRNGRGAVFQRVPVAALFKSKNAESRGDLSLEAGALSRLSPDDDSVVCVQVPGRVNLIGEHTDYNGGWVLPVAIDLHTRLWLRLHDDGQVWGFSRELGSARAALGDAPAGDWLDYARGVALELDREHGIGRHGFELEVESDLPIGAGLSSSAALTVGVGLALTQLFEFAQQGPEHRLQLARSCRRVEKEFIGVPCGLMDPLILLVAEAEHALRIDCEREQWEFLPLPARLELLMQESQGSLDELFEVMWTDADLLVEAAGDLRGVFGSPMTGAGWGGCTLHLVATQALEQVARKLCAEFEMAFDRPPRCWRSRAVGGARVL